MDLPEGLRCVLVSHTHWDREWYRTFESFRGRLVDAVDRVLELLADDPARRFVLDGQSIVLALLGWAEPWTALGRRYGTPDERPALRLAWRALVANQAHDSICGCSIDAVHDQMQGRYDTAEGLAESTTSTDLCQRC